MAGSIFDGYDPQGFFDEVVGPECGVRAHYREVVERLSLLTPEELSRLPPSGP